MSDRASYKTKQQDVLIQYLSKVSGKHITVNDACDYFRSNGENIGTTTVYRHLEKLVDEGLVKKYIIDGKSPACFEYLGSKEECGENCIHCKCEKCGKLIHLHCEELNEVRKHVSGHHGFTIDEARTVFYGICDECGAEK